MNAETLLRGALVHRGTRAVQRMVECAPSTGALALWVRHRDLPDDAPPAGFGVGAGADAEARSSAPLFTDGTTLLYAPAFERLELGEQVGWVAHAVLHVALRHPQRLQALRERVGDVDATLFNLCADAVVNTTLSHLSWLALPRGALHLEALLFQALGVQAQPAAALLAWDVERLYREIDDRGPPPARGGRRGARQGGGGGGGSEGDDGAGRARRAQDGAASAAEAAEADQSDDSAAAAESAAARRPDGPRSGRVRALGSAALADLVPGGGEGGAPEDEAEQARLWLQRLQRAHASDGEFSMLRALGADLPRTRTPWAQVLRVRLARALAPQPAPSWSRPARSWLARQGRGPFGTRLPWEPGTSAMRPAPRLVLVVDISGSVDDALLARFGRELDALRRRHGAAMTLVLGDDRVRAVHRLEPGAGTAAALKALACEGGGDTDFTPLLAEAEAHAPDLIVVLTDLEGPARHRPACPVLWAVPPAQAQAVAPFGRLLVLDD